MVSFYASSAVQQTKSLPTIYKDSKKKKSKPLWHIRKVTFEPLRNFVIKGVRVPLEGSVANDSPTKCKLFKALRNALYTENVVYLNLRD